MFWQKNKVDQRSKQLKELTEAFPSIIRPNNDDSCYELLFEVSRTILTLKMSISTEFPSHPPSK